MKEIIDPIVNKIKTFQSDLAKMETKYESLLYLSNERDVANRSADIKIQELLEQQKQGIIKINLSDDTVYVSKYTIINCFYDSLLKYSIDSDNIFLDFESSVFELFMEIIRNSQLETEFMSELNKVKMDCKNYNQKTNFKYYGEKYMNEEKFKVHLEKFFKSDADEILERFTFDFGENSIEKIYKPEANVANPQRVMKKNIPKYKSTYLI
jgi:hypothetical protein